MRESRTWKMIIRYSRGEEVFNMVSHIAGGGLAAAITALCVIKASFSQQVLGIVGTSVYGAMLVIYYSISSIYHGLAPRIGAKKVFRSLDGCAEFLLCAGTNTLFAFGVIGKASTALGWTYFGIIWGIAVTGILFNAFDPDKFKIVSVVLYLVIWWSLTAAVPILFSLTGLLGIGLLFGGLLAYTAGTFLNLFDQKEYYLHSLGHLCIVVGSILHFVCIFFFVL